jgi:histidinol-phosphate aminotransferase
MTLKTKAPKNLVRPIVRKLHAYVPGEQPRIKGLIKLNTNENPYPPSPHVLESVKAAVDGRLRLYPNPAAQPLREALARLHGCGAENIIIGNGSDDLLALATRAFVEPVQEGRSSKANPETAPARSRSTIQAFDPSYSLYPVLAAIHGARFQKIPLAPGFDLPALDGEGASTDWDHEAALSFITTPNAPTGRGYATSRLEGICRDQRGVVVLDEAYVDFAAQDALRLALELPQVLVSRTFSKAYSLCFQRVGYFVGPAELIGALDKVRDSYNVNGLGQVAALATLEDLDYYRANFRRIIQTRTHLARELERVGFRVNPSETNFLLVRPPVGTAKEWLGKLRDRRILVRWFDVPRMRNDLRITIGSQSEIESLIRAVRAILKTQGSGSKRAS